MEPHDGGTVEPEVKPQRSMMSLPGMSCVSDTCVRLRNSDAETPPPSTPPRCRPNTARSMASSFSPSRSANRWWACRSRASRRCGRRRRPRRRPAQVRQRRGGRGSWHARAASQLTGIQARVGVLCIIHAMHGTTSSRRTIMPAMAGHCVLACPVTCVRAEGRSHTASATPPYPHRHTRPPLALVQACPSCSGSSTAPRRSWTRASAAA